MEVIETTPTTPTTKRKLDENDIQNQSKKIKTNEDKNEFFSSPSNVVDIQDIDKSDNVTESNNYLNNNQPQSKQNIITIPLSSSIVGSPVKSTTSISLPPPIKSTASEIPVIQNSVNLEIENLYLEGIRNELPKLDVTKEEDQLYRQLMEECIRTIKAYTYVSEKHLSNSTLKNAERDMNRAKKKYEKEKNRRIRQLEKSIKEKNKAQKEKERAIEKAEKEAKQKERLKAKTEKEKKEKNEKTLSTTATTKEEKPKLNLPSITSFFTVKTSVQSSNNNNSTTNQNKDTSEVVTVNDDVKSVDLAYQNTVKYLEICNNTYNIETEFKYFINKKKIQRKNKCNKKSIYHSKDNKLIQIIGTARNGNRIPAMSYIEDRISKVIGARHPLKCDPYVSYSFEDVDDTDEDDDEEGEEDEEGEDLSQADSNEEEEEIELEEECKEEGKNVNELDYHDGFLDSEENDQAMYLMNKINTGQRVTVIIQPYFGEIDNIPKELVSLKLIKI